MAKFAKIPRAEAPIPRTAVPRRLRERMQLYEDHVRSVEAGTVGRLVPEDNESARGLALRINRAARRANKPVKTWIDGNSLYFEPLS